ncbi:GAF domain-containing protein [Candidatus Solirubrobacter pratensis]|uniref:GAF domain-containing protein n=1 Tax=Candidatus Solirubrobacter pratensis TaxID=1298857 RepID=UPI000420B166|nr:GAF domain-containing protein [Candidatus Solirubrobacter pratensis]
MTAPTRARRVPAGAETALGFGAGLGTFAVVAVILAAADSDLVAALLAVVCAATVVMIARTLGAAYAAPVAIAGLVAYDWFKFPPTHPHTLPDSGDVATLLAYLAVAVLAGELGAYGGRRARDADAARSRLAQEQAALRRVAELVARGVSPDEIFAAVGREVGMLLGVDGARAIRYVYGDEEIEPLAGWTAPGYGPLPSDRMKLADTMIAAEIRHTGRVARVADYESGGRGIPEVVRHLNVRSAIGAPIIVDGRLWGAMLAWVMRSDPLPESAEARIASFTELIATAISNAEARAESERLTEEQAALRRVATLVARELPPGEIFMAVAEELAQLLDVDDMRVTRFQEGIATVVGSWGHHEDVLPVGSSEPLGGENVSSLVWRTAAPSRIDDYATATGPLAERLTRSGVRSAVGGPIVVQGQLWGAMIASSCRRDPLPASTEARIGEFTELVATSISNVQARADLAASRARLMEATDAERRKVVRDLHDGAQQRLVHTVITLKLALRALHRKEQGAPALVNDAIEQTNRAMAELHELAQGILPSVLTREGLRASVEALASRMIVPVELDVASGRLPAAVEATAYFVVAEALTNVAKHAQASCAEVAAQIRDGSLRIQVRDDGVGGARAEGSGLQGLKDRVAVLDGRLAIVTPPDGGTLVSADIPIPSGYERASG